MSNNKEIISLNCTKDGRSDINGRALISETNKGEVDNTIVDNKPELKNKEKSEAEINSKAKSTAEKSTAEINMKAKNAAEKNSKAKLPSDSALKGEGVTESQKDNSDNVKTDKRIALRKRRNLWSIKITIISLFLSAFISFLSELTASSEHIIVTVLLLMFLILCSILFDGIGVAATSCEIAPFVSMATRRVYGAKTALWLVKNNEKVSNVCNDVIGDIFGIISGACSAAIVVKIITLVGNGWQRTLTIIISSVVAALTIGGKAFLKNIAITNSKEFIFFIARIIGIFHPEERKRKKKQDEKKRRYEKKASIKSMDEFSDYGEAE